MKIFVGKGAGNLDSPVRTEIIKDNGISVLYFADRLSRFINNDRRNDEFVVNAVFIGVFDYFESASIFWTFAVHHGIISFFHPVPALVPVHGIISAGDRSKLADTVFLPFLLCCFRSEVPSV